MLYRRLGRTDIEASAIGFGCNRIADSIAAADRREIEATLREAFEQGINFYDTANVYGGGESEAVLGNALRPQRDKVVLCSKVGTKPWRSVLVERWTDPLRLRLRRLRRVNAGTPKSGWERPAAGFAPRFLELAVAGSLRRLGTDYLDLLYLHGPPPSVLRDPSVFAKLEDLRERGWIRWYGVSFTTSTPTQEIVAAVERWPGIAMVQVSIHPLSSVDLARVTDATRARGAGIVANQPFRKGALLADSRVQAPEALGRTRAQTLLRFAVQCPGVDVALVGMRSRAHLRENLAALDASPLTAEEMGRLGSSAEIR